MNINALNTFLTTKPLANTSTAPSAAKPAGDAKLKDACRQFEGVFFGMMLKEMRKTVPEDTLLGDEGHRQEIFQGMMDNEVSTQMSKQDTAGGLADLMYKQLAGTRGAQVASTKKPEKQP